MSKPTDKAPFQFDAQPATKSYAEHRLRFVPCGYVPEGRMTTTIYVRYKKTHELSYDKPVRVVNASDRWVHFDCPDRELMFTRDGLTLGGDRAFNTPEKQWDKAVHLNVASIMGNDLAFDRFMINTHGFGEKNMPMLRADKTHPSTAKVIMQDSGGFQIAHGALDFINPLKLAESYWDNADEGIVLDLPPRALSDDPENIRAVAELHRLNARAMDPNLPKGFRFGNVLHGLHINQVDIYRKLVEKDDIDYAFLCIAGALRFNIVETTHRCLHIITQGRQYPHYHLLGVGNPTLIALLAQMAYTFARAGKHVLLTADASSPIGFALNRAAYVHPVYYESFNPIRFGERMTTDKNYPGGSLPNAFKRFATSDQVAQAVGGYADLIHLYNSSMVQAPLIYSNQVQLSNYVLMMGEYARHLPPREYKELCMLQFHGSKHCVLLGVALDYLEYAMQHGINKAFARFAHYMPAFTGAKTLKPFATLMGDEPEEDDGKEMSRERFKGVIQNFLHFHKTGKEPEEKNKYKKASTGKTNWLMV